MIILPRCNRAFAMQFMKVKIWDFVWWRKKVIESWWLQLHPLEHVKISYLDMLLLNEPYWKFVCHSSFDSFVYSCLRPKLSWKQNQISKPSSKPAPFRNPWHSETHWVAMKIVPNKWVPGWFHMTSWSLWLDVRWSLQRILNHHPNLFIHFVGSRAYNP